MNFLTKEVKIALTAIAAVVLLFIGINFLKGVNIFVASNTYYVKFRDIAGLTVSSPVFANGYPVGIVRGIEYDYQNSESVVVRVELNDEMHVPAGTKAEIESELMGGVKMTLVLGPNPTQNLAAGDTIPGGPYVGALAKMSEMIPTVTAMLPKLDSILSNINRLTADPALMQTLHNAAAITAELRTTSAQLNTLMKNDVPQLTAHLNKVGANLETLTNGLNSVDIAQTMRNVDETLANAKQLTADMKNIANGLDAKINSTDNTLGLMLNDRKLYDGLTSTVNNADSLMIDLKAHPKRYVHFSVFGRKDK